MTNHGAAATGNARRRLARHATLLIPVLAGATIGWTMFGGRGVALFAAVALLLGGGIRLVARASSRVATAVAMLGAALALDASSTRYWGGGAASDGTRWKASPVGLSHVLTPLRTTSPTVNCGWHREPGFASTCEVRAGNEGAFSRLRAVYPLVRATALACVLAALAAILLPVARHGVVRAASAGVVTLVVAAVALFATSLRPALAVLSDVAVGTGGTLGTMQVATATIVAVAVASMPAPAAAPGKGMNGMRA